MIIWNIFINIKENKENKTLYVLEQIHVFFTTNISNHYLYENCDLYYSSQTTQKSDHKNVF